MCLDRNDLTRAHILAKKISPMAFKPAKGAEQAFGIEGTRIEAPVEGTPELSELKIRYYRLMIRYHSRKGSYLEMARAHAAILDTAEIAASAEKWTRELRAICWFLALSPHGVERSTLLHTTKSDPRLSDLPDCHELLKQLSTHEIIDVGTFLTRFAGELNAADGIFVVSTKKIPGTSGPEGSRDSYDPYHAGVGAETIETRTEALKRRLVEHNVLIVAKYYERLTMIRLAQLLQLEVEEAERVLAEMVIAKQVEAKMDRPGGIVTMGGVKDADDVLNKWSSNIERVLTLVNKVNQDIGKESMQWAGAAVA